MPRTNRKKKKKKKRRRTTPLREKKRAQEKIKPTYTLSLGDEVVSLQEMKGVKKNVFFLGREEGLGEGEREKVGSLSVPGALRRGSVRPSPGRRFK